MYCLVGLFQGHAWSLGAMVAYTAWSKVAFAVCLAGLCHVCFLGRLPWLTSLLGWAPLEPVARLTYGAYLLHYLVMLTLYMSHTDTLQVSIPSLIQWFFPNYVLAYLAAAAMFLFVEKPAMNLEAMVLRGAT